MKLARSIDTEHDVITASIICTEISDETKEALHDYTKILKYSNIDFSAKIKVTIICQRLLQMMILMVN